jgi:hypothetical protein
MTQPQAKRLHNNQPEQVVSLESMVGFFDREVATAVHRQQVKIGQHTQSYIVNLLAEYAKASRLHAPGEADTLAMLYLQSRQQRQEERVRSLRRLGDLALCIAGFFADSLNRKVVDVDYYIDMGGSAYGSLAAIFDGKREAAVFSELYEELATKFSRLVEVLNEVSEGTSARDQSMLRLYDRWLKTGSERIRRMLCEQGILPNQTVRRTCQ